MKDILTVKISGIRCDNPECDYDNADVQVEDYINWVNKPCPKCNSNLLTENDYNNVLFLLKIQERARELYPQVEDDREMDSYIINMNGSGSMEYELQKK